MKTRKIARKLVLIVSMMLMFSPSVFALQFRGASPRINNEAFLLDQEVVISQTISVNHKDKTGGAVSFFITFSTGQSGTFTNRELRSAGADVMYYNIYDNNIERNILKDLSANPSNDQVLTGSFTAEEAAVGGGTTKDITFTVILDPDQFPLAGTYQDTIEIKLYEGTPANSSGKPADTETMDISSVMDPVLEMSLLPDGGGFDVSSTSLTLDFGTMYSGSTRSADLRVRSNSTYGAQIRSANGGVMLIQDPNDSSVVPYLLTVNGNSVNLSSGADQPIADLAGPTGENGDLYDIDVQIQDYGMASEGLYSDILTITVLAQ